MVGHLTVILCALVLLSAAAVTKADTITVDLNGGADFTEVAPAVDAACQGDTVLVLPGYYQGAGSRNIDFNGKAIVLRSRDGRESTWLDPYSGFDNVLMFHSGESRAAVVEGFTVTGAVQSALVCDGASPTIRSCRFTNNSSNNWSQMFTRTNAVGGAADCSLLIEDCVFDNNYAEARIPTMSFHNCVGATIRGCSFVDNTEGYSNIYDDPSGVIVFWQSSGITIEECDFTNNDVQDCCVSAWGALGIDVVDCTFAGNVSSIYSSSGEGLLHFEDSRYVEISGCTVSGNLNTDNCVSMTGSSRVAIDRCTFVANGSAPSCSAEEVISIDTASGVISVSNSVLAFNDGLVPIACDGTLPTLSACCFYETGDPDAMCEPYDPETLLLEDPLFCGFYAGDYTLCLNSPCLVPNNDWGVQIGAHGWGCDACDSPVEATSWGAIKAMFR